MGHPEEDLRALFDLYGQGLTWHCLCAVTRLEVPEHLAAGPVSLRELAAAVDAHEPSLRRVFRLLVNQGIVAVDADRVELTDRGRLLTRAHPLSQHATFATVGPPDVAHALLHCLRTGEPAAPPVLGTSFWDYLAAHPDQGALFDEQMRQQAGLLSLACVPLLDWTEAENIADLAGGTGTVIAAVLRAAPHARGVLVDQPAVLDRAQSYLESAGVADRCALSPGDLFAPAPAADVYVLARVLHDWDDEDVVRILTSIAESARPRSVLRIFEQLIPDDGGPHPAQVSDVAMLLLFGGGRERTAVEFQGLLDRAGWTIERIVPSESSMSVVEARRLP